MERKISKLLALTGVIAGTTAALTPLTSYAAEGVGVLKNCPGDASQQCPTAVLTPRDIELNVESKISLDTATGTDLIYVAPNSSGIGKISATVTSNQGYNILLSAAQPSLVKDDDPTKTIAAKNALTPSGQAWWGIKKYGASDYTGLTTTDEVFYSSSTSAHLRKTDFEVNVTAPSGTITGIYKTEITVIAAPKT